MRAMLFLFALAACNRESPPGQAYATAPASRTAAVPPKKDAQLASDPVISAGEAPSSAKFSDAKSAMAELVSAVLARDAGRLLECFSHKSKWTLSSTSGEKRRPSKYTFAQLQAGLKDEGDFRYVILGDSPDDNFRDEVEQTKQKPWRAKDPTTFIPPDELERDVFVKWRREGDRFVVQEIAFPF